MEAFKAYYRQMRAALSDIHVEVAEVVTEGDLTCGAVRGDGDGTPGTRSARRPKGTKVRIYRHDDGADQRGQDRRGVEQLRLPRFQQTENQAAIGEAPADDTIEDMVKGMTLVTPVASAAAFDAARQPVCARWV